MTIALDPTFLVALAAVPALAWSRWFGNLTRSPSPSPTTPAHTLVATFPLPPARGHAAICLFETAVGPESGMLHQAVLRRWAGAAPDGADVLHEEIGADGLVIWTLGSAWADDGLRTWLREALLAGASIRDDGWEWLASPEQAVGTRDASGSSRPIGGRRHDVVFFAPGAIGVCYRRLTRGASPELDLLRHLERVPGERVAPTLLGSAIIRSPNGERTASCILEDIVPNTDTVEVVLIGRLSRALMGDPSLQAVALDDVRAVGVTTRELHSALGRPFDLGILAGAIPATTLDVEAWVARAWSALSNASLAYGRSAEPLSTLIAAMRILPGKLQQFGAAAELDPGLIHRVHGNHRLDNVLMEPPRNLSVVEFDGDAFLSDRERVLPQSPWRDVARLLVSIAEAAAQAACDNGGDEKALEIAWLWEREARKAYLEGYGSGGGALHALLAIFELEFASRLLLDSLTSDGCQRLVATHTLERLSRSIV